MLYNNLVKNAMYKNYMYVIQQNIHKNENPEMYDEGFIAHTKSNLITQSFVKSNKKITEYMEKTTDFKQFKIAIENYKLLFHKKVINFTLKLHKLTYEQKIKKLLELIYVLCNDPSQKSLCGLIYKTEDLAINFLNPFRLINILKNNQNFLKNDYIKLYGFHAIKPVENPTDYDAHEAYCEILSHYIKNCNNTNYYVNNDDKKLKNIFMIEDKQQNTIIFIPENTKFISETTNEDINLLHFADTYVDGIVYPYSSIGLLKKRDTMYVPLNIGYTHGNVSIHSKYICYGDYYADISNAIYLSSINATSTFQKVFMFEYADHRELLYLFRDKEMTKTIIKNYLKKGSI